MRVAHDVDRAIDHLARRQHGVFHRRQTYQLGATPKIVRNRLANGQWLALADNVFALPSHPATVFRQLKAAELSVPTSAIGSRHAASLHGLDGARPGRIRLVAERGAKRTSELASVHRVEVVEATVRRSIRVLTVGATIVDLAGLAPLGTLERVLDSALVKRLTTIEDLAARQAAMRCSRAPGSAALGALVEDRLTGFVPPTNELERAAAMLLADPRVPPAQMQVSFDWWDEEPMRVDFFIPAWRRIIEVDGRLWHARFADFELDRRRDQTAQMHGVEVSRFTYRQVMHEPEHVLGVLLGIGRHIR
jgi:hypothetical protein